jgi:predicted AlkP superfamily phosphohydrolase/phosphomutase
VVVTDGAASASSGETMNKRVAAVGITIAVALALALGCGERGGPGSGGAFESRPAFLLIGIDGLDWERVSRLVDEGRMPNTGRLITGGASGMLRSIHPYRSPSVWTTIATGKTEEKHGISGFMAYGPAARDEMLASSNLRNAKAIWQILSSAERSVGIIGWLVTYPADPVNGYMISSLSVLQLSRRPGDEVPEEEFEELRKGVYPPELWDAAARFRHTEEDIPEEDLLPLLGTTEYLGESEAVERMHHLARFRAADLTALGMAEHLFAARETDFSAIYFRGNDIVSHFFWRYMEPDTWKERPSEEMIETFAPVIDRYYELADDIVGRLLAIRDERTIVILLSDHGFAGHRGYPGFDGGVAMGTNMHREQGTIVLNGPNIVPGAEIEGASVLDVTPTVLALSGLPIGRDMDGKPLVAAIDRAFLARHPVAYVDTYESQEDAGDTEPVASPIDDEVKEMLRSLGYID